MIVKDKKLNQNYTNNENCIAMILTTEQKLKKEIKNYIVQSKYHLLTSRFNTETCRENELYRLSNPKIGCIYCAPSPITKTVAIDSIVFVLEMNNDTNKIVGIGMVTNHPRVQKYNVYGHGDYNRYSYIGKYRIGRDSMTEEENQTMKIFDILCFKGNKHMKRGQGLKLFPGEILYTISKRVDLLEYIELMFKSRFFRKEEENPNN
jgi:hypothetical protein